MKPNNHVPYQTDLPRRKSCILAACSDMYACCLFVSLKSLLEHSPILASQTDIWVAGIHISQKHKAIFPPYPRFTFLITSSLIRCRLHRVYKKLP